MEAIRRRYAPYGKRSPPARPTTLVVYLCNGRVNTGRTRSNPDLLAQHWRRRTSQIIPAGYSRGLAMQPPSRSLHDARRTRLRPIPTSTTHLTATTAIQFLTNQRPEPLRNVRSSL